MNTAKIYQNSDGEDCSITQMVREEPMWAANRIQEGEKAIEILDWIDKNKFKFEVLVWNKGKPLPLRGRIRTLITRAMGK